MEQRGLKRILEILETEEFIPKNFDKKTSPRLRKGTFHKGVIIKKSNCCNAPLEYSSGGVKILYCTNCGEPYREIIN